MGSPETSPTANRSNPNTGKRRSTWRSLLTPSYKSRSDEFLKLFCDTIPSTERLIADYSCALHREILIHGRIYISINYIAFYSNLFSWVTKLVVKLRDVSEIYKANTAKFIPNAIQIVTTNGDKHVFASFIARDKSYVMILRIWQNNLMFERMSDTEIRNLVHFSYGRDLGMTDDEEFSVNSPEPPSPGILALDLVPAATTDIAVESDINDQIDKNSNCNNHIRTPTSRKEDTSSENSALIFAKSEANRADKGHRRYSSAGQNDIQRNDKVINQVAEKLILLSDQNKLESNDIHSEEMDAQDKSSKEQFEANYNSRKRNVDDEASLGCRVDEEAEPVELTTNCQCANHTGQVIVDYEFDINVDTLFTLIFTNSKFMRAYMARRGLFDLVVSSWKKITVSSSAETANQHCRQSRQLTYSMNLNHVLAKQVDVEEAQTISEIRDGVYAIQSKTTNSGIPYSEAFTVDTTYCLTRKGDINKSRMIVHTLVNFKKEKNNWKLSIVKAMIERQSLQGVTGFITDLKVSINQYISNPSDFDQDIIDDATPKNYLSRDKLRKRKYPIGKTGDENESSSSEQSEGTSMNELSTAESINGSCRSTLRKRKRTDSTTINYMTISKSNSEDNLDSDINPDSTRSRRSAKVTSANNNIQNYNLRTLSYLFDTIQELITTNKQMLVLILIILLIIILVTNLIILHRLIKLENNCKPNISTDYGG